jgi:S1-C subfamily serine protease
MSRSTQLPRAAALAGVALLGGLVALAGAALVGGLGDESTTTTVVQTAPADSRPAAVRSGLSVAEIYERAAPGVVQITSTAPTLESTRVVPAPPVPSVPSPPQQALGSGFVIDKTGHIVTNYHVIEGAGEIEVSFSNQDTLTAKLVGSDPSSDIAVLRVEASSRGLTPLDFGDSDDVRVGDAVVAIGNPFGLERSASAGIVSAVQERTITAPNGYPIDHVIQTDAAINSGNSGGPLLNDRGEVIGVNSQISTASGSTGNVGIGFAVPANTVKNVVAQLIDKGKVDRAFIGIEGTSIDPDLAQQFRLPVDTGVLVERVVPATPAARAGLRGGTSDVIVEGHSYRLGGDVIVALDGKRVASLEDLRQLLSTHKPGDIVRLGIYRDTKRLTVELELGRQPLPSG